VQRRLGSGALILSVLAAGCADSGYPPAPEILWDTWGVPHIYADSDADLFRAFGWAQMEAHGDLILRLMGQARGQAAEYWGEEYLEGDRMVHTMGVPDLAERWTAEMTPEEREVILAFLEGMNAYGEEHPEALADDVEGVLPLRAEDVMAHFIRVVPLGFIAGSTPQVAAQWNRRLSERGSNAWAIAPSRSASGNALLLANPHLPWQDFFTWFEVHLNAPGVNAYGATLVGFPIMGIAFNEHLGWSHTVNTFDGVDHYELELVDGGYRWNGGVEAFQESEATVRVRDGDGMREETLPVRRSVHGPVVSMNGDRALAVRVTGLDRPGIVGQYLDMIKATGLEEFEAAQAQLQMPFFNTIYADREGHIYYLFGGALPRRNGGSFQEWMGVVPGVDESNLWTGVHAYEDLPRLVDPATGWIQNANDPPWTSTIPQALDPGDYPAYTAPTGMAFRPQRSARMLAEDPSVTFAELLDYKHDTRMEVADRILDDLAAAVAEHGDEDAREGMAVLEAWDRTAQAESRGGFLFETWFWTTPRPLFAEEWDPERPLDTPDGLSDPAGAASALSGAVQRVREAHGAPDVAWGDVYRFRMGDRDLPANGGNGALGVFRVMGFAPDGGQGGVAAGGDSYVAAVEFSDPVRAKVLLSYGNHSQPGSPHRGDQLDLLSRQELRDAWLTREEVEANLKAITVLQEAGSG
jgi:acyl-homoserine-lactone acylase